MTEDVALEQSDLDWCLVITKYAIPTVNELVQKIGPISLRTLHYNLVSREIIPNTRSGYNTLSKYIVKARKEGIVLLTSMTSISVLKNTFMDCYIVWANFIMTMKKRFFTNGTSSHIMLWSG